MSISTQLLRETANRYRQRESIREEIRRKIESGLLLQADSLERVEKRFKRLGILGTEFDIRALEQVIHKNDLMSVNYLELGLIAARSVGRIRIRNRTRSLGFGTGFMVSPRLLLTNNHVLENAQQATFSQVEFNFQDGIDGQPLTSIVFGLEPEVFFLTNEHLDYTLVAVRESAHDGRAVRSFGWNPLIEAQGKVIAGEYVSIIQHPGGELKQLALRENQIIDVLDDFLHYQTDTAPGSSGSPVFNDQWEVVALHHSAVPKQDEKGNVLAKDGTVWTEDKGEDQIAWIANEGVRISQIVKHIKEQNLSDAQRRLRDEMFEGAPSLPTPRDLPASDETDTVDAVIAPSNSAKRSEDNQNLHEALEELEAGRAKPYYDEVSDGQNRAQYYSGIIAKVGSLNPTEFFEELSDLLKRTHREKLAYEPSKYVYPWVDLHPDHQLRSIYSGQEFDPEEIIRQDFRISQERTALFRELLSTESAMSAELMVQELELLEARLPFNTEHVVPQSWFDKQQPMKGDLHHLFACEPDCNSYRGNIPFFDFPNSQKDMRTNCGMRISKENKFEPNAGKGAVARATLYFLLRYPGDINKTSKEYTEDRLETLLAWHKSHQVTDYERHRNMAIFEKQGNRNPLIDFPEWADEIDFRLGLGEVHKRHN